MTATYADEFACIMARWCDCTVDAVWSIVDRSRVETMYADGAGSGRLGSVCQTPTEDETMTSDDVDRIAFQRMQRAALDYAELHGECEDDSYIPGCGEFDTRDSKGDRLLPRVNEAGEPRWM